MLDVSLIVFYAFATLLIGSATMVILSISPVRGALFLVLAFFASSVLWLLIEAEFLALALIFVYVGAVMTLFLFVVMMLNLDTLPSREGFVRYLPFGVIVMAMFVSLMIYAISPIHFSASAEGFTHTHPAEFSNAKDIGEVLYTQYLYPFELAGALLLVAIIASITLAFRGRQNSKSQRVSKQLLADRADRLRVIDIKVDKP